MKKLLSLALALIMVLSLSVAVFADTTYKDVTSVSIGVRFDATNGSADTPQETFHYTITAGAVIDGNADGNRTYVQESSLIDAEPSVPMPATTTYDVAMTPGAEDGSFTIVLPEYSSVGIYYYTVTQTEGNTAGVKYDTRKMIVKVTVIQQEENKVRVAFATASLADNDAEPGTDVKTATFVNTYSAGELQVTKHVTGILGDKTKYFEITVTLTGEAGMTYAATYPVSGGSKLENGTDNLTKSTISVGTPATFWLKDGETFTISNLPYGVTYKVEEKDYTTSDKYDPASIVYGDVDKKIDTGLDTVTITNNKDGSVDTGIVLDSLPYVLLIAVAVVGMVIFTARKRSHREY